MSEEEMPVEPKPGKTESKYWMLDKKLVFEDSRHLTMPVTFKGRRLRFQLGTHNKRTGAVKAAEIYCSLVTIGVEKTLEKYKPKGKPRAESPTVGEFIDIIMELDFGILACTKRGYITAFRTIVSEIAGVDPASSRRDHIKGGNEAWLAKIHDAKMTCLTDTAVEEWRQKRLSRAAGPLGKKKARASINAYLTRVKRLFAPGLLKKISDKINLPEPIPFANMKREKQGKARYISKIDAESIYSDSQEELSSEPHKLLVLGLACGLRNHEADLLPWAHVDIKRGAIRIENTKWFQVKSESSRRVVWLDASVTRLLVNWQAEATGEFVVESPLPPKLPGAFHYERCKHHFDTLRNWLRSKGVTAQKPYHEMRKEYGSLLNSRHGIHAASMALGHSDISVTTEHYADSRNRPTAGFGEQLL